MHTIRCAEVWGGIQNEDLDACSRTVTASLYSCACDGGKGGDVYFLSVCAWDDLTRIAIADVCGHGEAVSALSRGLHAGLTQHMNELEGEQVLRELNLATLQHGYKAITTAAIVGVCRSEKSARFAYAGHHPVLLRRSGNVWRAAERSDPPAGFANLPLGVSAETTYDAWEIPVETGDRLLFYTDGVIEAPDATGELFGVERLEATANALAAAPLHEIKTAILRDLSSHTVGDMTHDDVTVLCVELR